MHRSSVCLVFLVLVLFAVGAAPLGADAPNTGLAMSPAPGNQSNLVVSPFPGVIGGTAVFWTDARGGGAPDIYGTRLTKEGVLTYGVVPVVAGPGEERGLVVAPDPNAPVGGGWFLAWANGTPGDIHATWASLGWPGVIVANGPVAMCTATGEQDTPAIAAAGGRSFVTWRDARSGAANTDVYIQVLDPYGAPWTANGVLVCGATGNQAEPQVCADGTGGAIVVWTDYRGGANADIYAQRVNAFGTPLWLANGIPVCAAAGVQSSVRILPDGLGGAFIAWTDGRSAATGTDVYAQHVDAGGVAQWTAGGVAVSTAPGNQTELRMEPRGYGGFQLGWVNDASGNDIYVARMDGFGNLDAGGEIAVCTAPGNQNNLRMMTPPDDPNALLLTWDDSRGPTRDVYAQYLNEYASPLWPWDGLLVCGAPGDQLRPAVADDDSLGALVVWEDARVHPTNLEVYAQRINVDADFTFPDTDRPRILAVRDVPGDQGGKVVLEWTGGRLDGPATPVVTGYRVWRRTSAAPGVMATLQSERTLPLAERRYLAYPEAGLTAAAGTYWEAVATLPVQGLAGYGYTAATTQDSLPGDNPYTAFFVTALTGDAYGFYASDVDSGYSVDNLAPEPPAPFKGVRQGLANRLRWGANREEDFAVYRLYRGADPGFVPGPGNLVAVLPDTGYVDASAGDTGWTYKLSAVDVHQNESGFAVLHPGDMVGIPGDAGPALPWLGAAAPNPMTASSTVRFGLPADSRVTLSVFDIRGALVRTVADAGYPAGEHALSWDGRDDAGGQTPSGVYFYRLTALDRTLTGRVVVRR